MKSSIAIAAALVLASLAFTTGTAAARGGGFGGGFGGGHGGQIVVGHSGHGANHAQPAFWGRGYRYGYGYGPGWCYWHPYSCYRFNR
jgi:hypothetical protein